ncbi:MAG TPA: hypothetical protein VLL54_14415 [Pyrinomonadaceae bacterium]|nr:hypothetical protein [Pyrinomonadaceae bacterium]
MKNLRSAFRNPKLYLRFVMLVAVLGTLAALTPLSTATTPSLTVSVVNNSAKEIRHIYLSPANNDDWGTDQLNESVINAGASRTLSISWDQSTVKLVGEDQDGCFLYQTVEASGSQVWTIDNQSARDCGN